MVINRRRVVFKLVLRSRTSVEKCLLFFRSPEFAANPNGTLAFYTCINSPQVTFIPKDMLNLGKQALSNKKPEHAANAHDVFGRMSSGHRTKKSKRKVQGMPQSQTAAISKRQEEEETDITKQAQIEQTYEKH